MFRFGSKKDVFKSYSCTIRLLDDNEVLQYDYQGTVKGQVLLEYACKALNLLEKDYFGLRYVDSSKQRHWLDPTKSIWKQVRGLDPIVFCFRVKFYPPDPYRLKEEITRYQMFLQLRRDLLHGRLYCSQSDSALLAAYIIQSELGDYDPDEHVLNYVSEFKLLLKQTQRLEEKITEMHQGQLRGQVPAVTEMNFLRKACILDTYGVDPHPVKDHKGNQLYLGINHAGILTFQGSRKTHHFKWVDIQKINYEGKMFIIHLLFSEKKHLIGFKCPTLAACQHLWRCAVEQRYFFNMGSSADVPNVTTGGGIFSRTSRFRYSGRVEKEIVEDMKQYKRDPPPFQRSLTMTSFRLRPNQGNDSIICPETPATHRPTNQEEDKNCDEDISDYPKGFTPLEHINNIMSDRIIEEEEKREVATSQVMSPPKVASDPKLVKELSFAPLNAPQATPSTPANQKQTPMILTLPENRKKSLTNAPKPGDLSKNAENHQPLEKNSSVAAGAPQVTAPVVATTATPSEKRTAATTASINHVQEKRPASAPSAFPLVEPTTDKMVKQTNDNKAKHFKANSMRGVLVASLSLLVMLSCLLVLVLESDSPLFSELRKIPEMILLRRQYYEPTKEYIAERVNVLFK